MSDNFDMKKVGNADWNAKSGLHYRSYDSYEEYTAHQAAKLSKIDLEEYNIKFREALKERLTNLEIITPGKNVLCLAARMGAECRAFIDMGCFAIGVDLNPGQGNRYVVVGDFHNLQFADNSVDYIFTNSLDHAFDLPRILSEVVRVLKQDGIFITELMPAGFKPGAFESCRWESMEEIIRMITEAGFVLLSRKNFKYPWNGVQIVWKKKNEKPQEIPERQSIIQNNSEPISNHVTKAIIQNSSIENQKFPWSFSEQNIDTVFEKLLTFFKPNIVCDIGSLDGSASIKMRKLLPNAEIFAFEANPENFFDYNSQPLKENIHFLPLGISNFIGETKLYVPNIEKTSKNAVSKRGTASLRPKSNGRECITYNVPVSTLDVFFAGANKKLSENYYALWIDVEGLAYEVLEGAIQQILPKTYFLKVELEGRQHWQNQKLDTEVKQLLLDLGFIEIVNKRNSIKSQQSQQYDAIFINPNLCDIEKIRKFLLEEIPSIEQSTYSNHSNSQTEINQTKFARNNGILKEQDFVFVFPVKTNKLTYLDLNSYESSSLIEFIKRFSYYFGINTKLKNFNTSDFINDVPQIDTHKTVVIAQAPHRLEKTLSGQALDNYLHFMTSVEQLYLIHFGSPSELSPTKIEKEIYAHARHLFCWCGHYWWEGKNLGEIGNIMMNKISHLIPAIASELIPYRPHLNPGELSFLHMSKLSIDHQSHLILGSLPNDSKIFISSESLVKNQGDFSYKGKDKQKRPIHLDFSYSPVNKFKIGQFENICASIQISDINIQREFSSLGYVTGSNSEFSDFLYNQINYYIHASRINDMTSILEACARGILPCVSVESGFNSPSAIYLTDEIDSNQTILHSLSYITEQEYLLRVEELRQWVIDKHNWEQSLSIINSVIDRH